MREEAEEDESMKEEDEEEAEEDESMKEKEDESMKEEEEEEAEEDENTTQRIFTDTNNPFILNESVGSNMDSDETEDSIIDSQEQKVIDEATDNRKCTEEEKMDIERKNRENREIVAKKIRRDTRKTIDIGNQIKRVEEERKKRLSELADSDDDDDDDESEDFDEEEEEEYESDEEEDEDEEMESKKKQEEVSLNKKQKKKKSESPQWLTPPRFQQKKKDKKKTVPSSKELVIEDTSSEEEPRKEDLLKYLLSDIVIGNKLKNNVLEHIRKGASNEMMNIVKIRELSQCDFEDMDLLQLLDRVKNLDIFDDKKIKDKALLLDPKVIHPEEIQNCKQLVHMYPLLPSYFISHVVSHLDDGERYRKYQKSRNDGTKVNPNIISNKLCRAFSIAEKVDAIHNRNLYILMQSLDGTRLALIFHLITDAAAFFKVDSSKCDQEKDFKCHITGEKMPTSKLSFYAVEVHNAAIEGEEESKVKVKKILPVSNEFADHIELFYVFSSILSQFSEQIQQYLEKNKFFQKKKSIIKEISKILDDKNTYKMCKMMQKIYLIVACKLYSCI